MKMFIKTNEPLPVIVADWYPKCNSENELRIHVELQILLSDALAAQSHKSIQKAYKAVGEKDSPIPEAPISTEITATVECYATPESKSPMNVFSGVLLRKILVFRDAKAEGASREVFLSAEFDVKVGKADGPNLVGWLLLMLKKTMFCSFHEVQGTLPGLEDEEPARPKSSKKSKLEVVN